MGAFFLYRKHTDINELKARLVFSKKGFKDPKAYDYNSFKLLHYSKILIPDDQFLSINGYDCFLTGTLIYRNLGIKESFNEVISDFISTQLDYNSLLGHFCIVIHNNGSIKIIRDFAGTYDIYYDTDGRVFSSSFLAIAFSLPYSLSINKFAITEILLTGNLVGSETQLEQIKKIMNYAYYKFDNLQLLTPKQDYEENDLLPDNFNDAISEQIARLDEYFSRLTNCNKEYGFLIGLTGGFDSRLLSSICERNLKNIEYFTHWQYGTSTDFIIAEKIANELYKPLLFTKFHDVRNKSSEEINEHIEKAFYFTDGQIRSQYYWHEIYNIPDYYKLLAFKSGLIMNGIGGEQYRNGERMLRPSYDYIRWLLNNVLMYYTGNIFISNRLFKDFSTRYIFKISEQLGLINAQRIQHLDVKKYFNEVYNLSNRTLRTNIENTLIYHLSPFTDSFLSKFAYRAVPFLGKSYRFQGEMINRINPDLANITSRYGYTFSDIPLFKEDLLTIVKESIPYKYTPIINKIKSYLKTNKNTANAELISVLINKTIIDELGLPIKWRKVLNNPALAPLPFEISYFIQKL